MTTPAAPLDPARPGAPRPRCQQCEDEPADYPPILALPAAGTWRERIRAPFTPDQVASLATYQNAGLFHPYTCGGGGGPCSGRQLTATTDGLRCPDCGRTQGWVHAWTADWSWLPDRDLYAPDRPIDWPAVVLRTWAELIQACDDTPGGGDV